MSSLFNHSVTTQISVDGNPAQIINLTNPAGGEGNQVVALAVVWYAHQLSNTPHTVVVSMAPGEKFVKMDAFMYAPIFVSYITDGRNAVCSYTSDTSPIMPSQSLTMASSPSSGTPTSSTVSSSQLG